MKARTSEFDKRRDEKVILDPLVASGPGRGEDDGSMKPQFIEMAAQTFTHDPWGRP